MATALLACVGAVMSTAMVTVGVRQRFRELHTHHRARVHACTVWQGRGAW